MNRTLPVATVLLLLAGCSGDSPPFGDDRADTAGLRGALHESMSGNRVLRYGDTWEVLADGAEVAPGRIRLFYTRRVIPAAHRASGDDQAAPDNWNREHVWPQSYGLRDTSARTDVHNLVPVDRTVNSSRGSKLFDDADTPHHECAVCRVSADAWEPSAEVQGDVARIAFYMDVRYAGRDADVPDLSLSDDPSSEDARFGNRTTLVEWHCADPVSAEERRRHEVAARAQGNRNVFVDDPALAGGVFGFSCDD